MSGRDVTLLGIVLIAVAVGVFVLRYDNVRVPDVHDEAPDAYGWEHVGQYRNSSVDLSFAYPAGPDGYVLVEQSEDTAATLSLSLFETREYIQLQTATEPREGPPAISARVFPADGATSTRQWLANTDAVHMVMDETVETIEMAGVSGITFRSDGLYTTEHRAALSDDTVYLVGVEYLDESDDIRKDAADILETLSLNRVPAEEATHRYYHTGLNVSLPLLSGVTVHEESDRRISLHYLGPDNEPGTEIVDGFTVTVFAAREAHYDSVRVYAEELLADARSNSETEVLSNIEEAHVGGHNSFTFRIRTGSGTTADVYALLGDDGHGYRISTFVIDPNEHGYRDMINTMLSGVELLH